MRTKNYFNLAFILVAVLFLNSCTQDNDSLSQEEMAFDKFEINALNSKETNLYTTNYQINSQTSTLDFENGIVNLEIPVPLNDYTFLKAYNVSTDNNPAILYLVTRNSTENVSDLPISYTISATVSYKDLGITNDFILNNGKIDIFVSNNSVIYDKDYINCFKESLINNIKNNCSFVNGVRKMDFEPLVTEDGVIVFFPEL